MTERNIQRALYLDRNKGAQLVCTNYTPLDWWEADVFLVTKRGYAVEFEIKLSVTDFKADAQKERQFYENREHPDHSERWRPTARKKHDLLAAGDRRAPSRFYYVFPKTLNFSPDLIPPWAGMLTVDSHPSGYYRVHEVKRAPQIHRTPADPKIVRHCQSVFYYRYWRLRLALKEKTLTELPEGAQSDQITGDPPEAF